MLGTQQGFTGSGIGITMMLHAFRQTVEVANRAGVYALTLESVDELTAQRYERWGFTRFVEGELLMFIPLSTIRSALSAQTRPQWLVWLFDFFVRLRRRA